MWFVQVWFVQVWLALIKFGYLRVGYDYFICKIKKNIDIVQLVNFLYMIRLDYALTNVFIYKI